MQQISLNSLHVKGLKYMQGVHPFVTLAVHGSTGFRLDSNRWEGVYARRCFMGCLDMFYPT
jgi:hypothetical protein